MHFKFLQSICELSDNRKIVSASWSPNHRKLAVATSDRQILIFDDKGVKRDKFATKAANAELGKRSYAIKAIAFSPDSCRLAVAQTDCYVFVYKLGDDWATKKAICNKFAQSAPVLCMVWLQTGPIICGLMDGKVRALQIKSNSSHSLYSSDSAVVSLCPNTDGTAFLSGHVDGSVIRCFVMGDDSIGGSDGLTSGKVVTHSVAPFALAWVHQGDVIAGGCDGRVVVYNRNGKTVKQFDYNNQQNSRQRSRSNNTTSGRIVDIELSVACVSPSAQAVMVGDYDKIRIYAWNTKQALWEEKRLGVSSGGDVNDADSSGDDDGNLRNIYTVECLAWRMDGAKIACGTLNGNVLIFESVLRRSIWKDKIEITFVGPSQIVVKPVHLEEMNGDDTTLTNINENVVLRSHSGQEIEDVKLMGRDRYCLARTKTTLLLADLFQNAVSEIPWNNSSRTEKFYFENAGVCLIFNNGELSLVEYGSNAILSCVRTEFANPHLVSVRLNERVGAGGGGVERNAAPPPQIDNKKLAYLIDLKTICIVDLMNGKMVTQLSHESKIDWLELNETCRKLLFRDVKQRLLVVDIQTDAAKTCIFSGVSFVQWVPNSDVCIAQSGTALAVWYNIDLPERPTIISIKGDVHDVIRENGTTEIVILDSDIKNQSAAHSSIECSVQLDEGLVEFGTAVHDHDYGKAILYLESAPSAGAEAEAEAMWYNLLAITQAEHNVPLIVRCLAAIGKNAKVFCAQDDVLNVGRSDADAVGRLRPHIKAPQEMMVKMDILNGNLEVAKSFYLERNDLAEIISLYRKLHKMDHAIALAHKMADIGGGELRSSLSSEHMRHLLASGQYERAGDLVLLGSADSAADNERAVAMYLHANRLVKVCALLRRDANLMADAALVSDVLKRLLQQEQFEPAAELYMRLGDVDMALDSYYRGKQWSMAVELARAHRPERVTQLEEEWGDQLCALKHSDAAISHYIEAGATLKALSAAVAARQWNKAVHIADAVVDEEDGGGSGVVAARCYADIAIHLAGAKEYKRAEALYVRAHMYDDVVHMYQEAGMWERAHVVAAQYLEAGRVREMYVRQAEVLEGTGRCREAERLYIAVNAPDLAITMYKRTQQYDNMVRLVEQYHPDLVQTTHLHLAQQMESQGKQRAAEIHYLAVGEWKAAMNMYRTLNMWEEAYRVAKQSGGTSAANQVAFLWSRTLPIESAIKLLTKFGILESSIDYACETYQYEFAFQLCKNKNLSAKKREVHYSYALALEDDGKYAEAETEFVLAERAKEAILMYTHGADWTQAMRVAEEHAPAALPEVLRAHAVHAYAHANYAQFETLLLRAQQPDAIVHKYKANGMWSDALRVCKEYMPQLLPALQDEMQRTDGQGATAAPSSSSADTMEVLLTRANELVTADMHKQAIECLLQVNGGIAEPHIVRRALLRAHDMTNNFLFGYEADLLHAAIAPRLREVGEFGAAAQIYAENMREYRQAVDCFIEADDWKSAGRVAKEFEPNLNVYIEDRYKHKLTREQNVEQLADVDILSALDLLVQQRQWTRCLEKARSTKDPALLQRYLALYATHLLRDGFTGEALRALHKEATAAAATGPLTPSSAAPIYNQIAVRMFALKDLGGDGGDAAAYEMWKMLRLLLFQLVTSLESGSATKQQQPATATIDKKTTVHFNMLLLITHYFAVRSACRQVELLKGLGARVSVAMLRYTDIIPADKAYYEAGLDMIADGKVSEAFVFLNHYLDVCEAIEEENSPDHQHQLVDHTELAHTDFPSSVPLPEQMFLQEDSEEHNRIREWVLTVSMDQKVEQSLPVDGRDMFEASLGTGQSACLLSGYPVLRPDAAVTFAQSALCANRDAWNKVLMAERLHPDCDVRDVLAFLQHWCGNNNN